MVSEWGDDVTCATVQTSPRYGFFVNALSVVLFFGGGITSFYMTYHADRDLGEAVEMWKNDRAEMAEMASRRAMIKKKEDYAALAASTAHSTGNHSVAIFKRKSASSTPATVKDEESPKNVGFSSVDFGGSGKGEKNTNNMVVPASPVLPSVLESPRRQDSLEQEGTHWDLESGPASTGGAEDNAGEVAVDEDLPPPEGWESRSTPSGEK